MKITENKDGTIIEVYVKPNSDKFEVTIEGEDIVVRSAEEPEKGKVNKEILNHLSKFFHAQVELVSGSASRKKRFLVKNIEKKVVAHLLQVES